MEGLELKLKRLRAGLTLWDLGQLTGVHAARLSEMERNQRVVAGHVEDVLDQVLEGTSVGSDAEI